MNEDIIDDIEQFDSVDNVNFESDANIDSEIVEETDSGTEIEANGSEIHDDTVKEDSGSEVISIPEYTMDSPLPVTIVEEVSEQEQLEVFSLTGSYYGTISDTYLDYFEGIVQKLKPSEHYVIWRSGQYAYTMCYGSDIELNGSTFTGTGSFVEIYRDSDSYNSNWYVSYGSDSLSLSTSKLFCYSDLGVYPTVERGVSHAESSALLITLAVITVFMLASRIFDFIIEHIYRK